MTEYDTISVPEGEYKTFCHFDFLKPLRRGSWRKQCLTLRNEESSLQFSEVKLTMSCILALFCPLAGSKWYFNYSYTCQNTWVRVIYASFDPSLEIVSVREIFKNLYPNDPSDKNFFWVSTNMYISSYWLSYMHSKWSEKHPRGFTYILGPILPNFNWSWAGPTGRYSENSLFIVQRIQKTG